MEKLVGEHALLVYRRALRAYEAGDDTLRLPLDYVVRMGEGGAFYIQRLAALLEQHWLQWQVADNVLVLSGLQQWGRGLFAR